jgi:cysteine-rich repeat protein
MKLRVALVALAVSSVTACTPDVVDQPPVALSRGFVTREDTSITFTLEASDPEHQRLTFAPGAPAHGTITGDGATFTYTPNMNFFGLDSAPVDVSDGHTTVHSSVDFTVEGVNDAPTAAPDSLTGSASIATTVMPSALTSNDLDVDGDTLTVIAVSNASRGSISLINGVITFTPPGGFTGPMTWNYTVSDGTLTAQGLVTMTLGNSMNAPTALDDTGTTLEDTALTLTAATLLANDVDVDRDTLSLAGVTNATHGTVTLSAGSITFTPEADFNGEAGFDYTVSDSALTDVGHVTITVTPVNDAPVAVDDIANTPEDTVLTLQAATLLANDTDDQGAPTLVSVANASNGTVALAGGVITFTPNANVFGAASFQYTITDGTLTATGRVRITITTVNDAPVAGADVGTGTEDTALPLTDVALLMNDTDVDSTTLTLTAVGNPTDGTVALAAGTITFTPEANYAGAATFEYTVSDGTATATGVVTLTLAAVNDAPVAMDDVGTTNQNVAVQLTDAVLLTNDGDGDGPTFTVTAVRNPTHGTVVRSAGVTTFTPAAGYTGPASFEYTVSDGTLTDVGLVNVTVVFLNHAPIAVDDPGSTAEDTAVAFNDSVLLANDSDLDGPITVSAVGNATNGTVVRSGTVTTFTPAANFTGTATFDYTISDGALTDVGVVTITVNPVNDAPVAVDDTSVTPEDLQLSLTTATLLANDSDVDGPALSITSVRNPVGGTVTLVGSSVLFVPTANTFGTASFEYVVSDGSLTDVGLVTITVNSVDDVPVAVADSASTNEDTVLASVDVLANDTGLGDGSLVVTITVAPTHGVAVVNGDNTIRYTPTTNYAGADTLTYQVADGDGDVATAALGLTVNAVNDAPVAVAQSVVTGRNAAKVITLTATDVDSASVTFALGTGPTHGTLGAIVSAGPLSATVTYTPALNSLGADSFTFTANDGALTSAVATVGLDVQATVVCGDGFVDAPEQCDDNGTANSDGCSGSCQVELGWNCTGTPSVCSTVCGDTNVVGAEQCDDGNASDTDGCTTQCKTGKVCNATLLTGGDAFATDPASGTCYALFTTEPTTFAAAQTACLGLSGYLVSITSAGEQARVQSITQGTPWIGAVDDANDTDAVFTWLKPEAWGYTHFAAGEPDDDAAFGGNGECLAMINPAGEWADTNCTFVGFTDGRICELPAAPCGDGLVEGAEACDDGNKVGSDGCSATCTVEAGATCSGTAPTTCAKLVINEIDYDNVGADNAGGQFEFVEILNAGTGAADLTNVALVLINGATPVEYFFDGTGGTANVSKRIMLTSASVPGNSLPPGGIIVAAPAGQFAVAGFPAAAFKITIVPGSGGWLQNGNPDDVVLMNVGATPAVIDAYSYEGTTANSPVVGLTGTFVVTEGTTNLTCDNGVASGMSRFPNGKDTQDNNADFALRTVTPGAPN